MQRNINTKILYLKTIINIIAEESLEKEREKRNSLNSLNININKNNKNNNKDDKINKDNYPNNNNEYLFSSNISDNKILDTENFTSKISKIKGNNILIYIYTYKYNKNIIKI
jgi:hypothetical protein